jgi:DNA (cytosine-5)-methyltransferase 1
MMGLPEGHVTDPAIWHGMTPSAARNAQLKALGNGVVPAQAAHALRILLGGVEETQPADGILLPTPAVNDMGAGKTPDAWDEWTARMQATHANGNGHGKSLAIEALRVAQ